MTWTERSIQSALTHGPLAKFYCRRWVAVPNVAWGLPSIIQGGREVDLLCVPPSMWVHAVEIKVSKSDLIADASKHWRSSGRASNIRFEWFAVPHDLAECALEFAPSSAGVLALESVERNLHRAVITRELRKPQPNNEARKITDVELTKLLRLGVMRMWSRRYE